MSDPVNHPPHYTSHPSGVECIDIVEHMPFNIGNAVKYVWRAGVKGGEAMRVVDLKKAIWYLEREVERIDRETARVLEESLHRDARPADAPKAADDYREGEPVEVRHFGDWHPARIGPKGRDGSRIHIIVPHPRTLDGLPTDEGWWNERFVRRPVSEQRTNTLEIGTRVAEGKGRSGTIVSIDSPGASGLVCVRFDDAAVIQLTDGTRVMIDEWMSATCLISEKDADALESLLRIARAEPPHRDGALAVDAGFQIGDRVTSKAGTHALYGRGTVEFVGANGCLVRPDGQIAHVHCLYEELELYPSEHDIPPKTPVTVEGIVAAGTLATMGIAFDALDHVDPGPSNPADNLAGRSLHHE